MVLPEGRPAVLRDEREGGGQRGERVPEGGRVGARAGGRRGPARARLPGPDPSRTVAGRAAARALGRIMRLLIAYYCCGIYNATIYLILSSITQSISPFHITLSLPAFTLTSLRLLI